jgi:hypothetical protein
MPRVLSYNEKKNGNFVEDSVFDFLANHVGNLFFIFYFLFVM